MIDWKTIKPVLLDRFSKMGGDIQTVWIDKRQPFVDPKKQAILKLRVRDTEGIGIDDRRYTDLGVAAPAPTLEETANGHRRVSLDVRCESFRHEDDRFAFDPIEMIRTGLGFRANQAALRAVNVAIIRVGRAQDLPDQVRDSRVVSTVVLEVTLNVGVCSTDPARDATPEFNIETVDNPVDHPNTVFDPPC